MKQTKNEKELKELFDDLEKEDSNNLNKAKLEILKELEKEVLNLGRTQMNNRMVLNFIDRQKILIGGDIENDAK